MGPAGMLRITGPKWPGLPARQFRICFERKLRGEAVLVGYVSASAVLHCKLRALAPGDLNPNPLASSFSAQVIQLSLSFGRPRPLPTGANIVQWGAGAGLLALASFQNQASARPERRECRHSLQSPGILGQVRSQCARGGSY
jgi:hypothetical protein